MSDLNPRVDIVFKKLFGVEENNDLLISLINAIVSKSDRVEDVEIINPYNERNFKVDKLTILDVKARRKKDGVKYTGRIFAKRDRPAAQLAQNQSDSHAQVRPSVQVRTASVRPNL